MGQTALEISTQLKTEYDRFKDVTTTRTYNFSLKLAKSSGGFSSVGVSAHYTFPGQKMPRSPQIIHLTIHSRSSSSRFLNPLLRDLIFLVDGKRLKIPSAPIYVNGGFVGGSVDELLGYSISRATFVTIANAKTAELQVGVLEGALTELHYNSFKALLAMR